MRNELLGTLRLSIIDNLRAEIREREGVIADLTKDEPVVIPSMEARKHVFFDGISQRPTPGDAVAEVRAGLKKQRKDRRKGLNDARRGKRVRRSAEDVDAMGQAFLRSIKDWPGMNGAGLRESIGATNAQMIALRKRLKGKFKTKGKRRSMTYWPKAGAK